MTIQSQNKNKQTSISANLKERLSQSNNAPISAERAARFLDTQEEYLENLAFRPEKEI